MLETIVKVLFKFSIIAVSAGMVVYLLSLLMKIGDIVIFTLNTLPGA